MWGNQTAWGVNLLDIFYIQTSVFQPYDILFILKARKVL